MKNKNTQKRWTIVNVPDALRDDIITYAKENGFTVSRALKELTKKDLRKWKTKRKEQDSDVSI
jgi:CRP-like cAMP-binding protein